MTCHPGRSEAESRAPLASAQSVEEWIPDSAMRFRDDKLRSSAADLHAKSRIYAAATGCAYGVDFTISSSSGVISAGTLANSGVER